MKFLANINNLENHLTTIAENLKVHKQAFFAVAFLKVSGFKHLEQPIKDFLTSGGELTIVAGQNFALTEPKALHELRVLFKEYPTSKLFLAKAHDRMEVFHPKLYLFKSQNQCCIISGSANITSGGLINNKETSIVAECTASKEIWINAKKYFDDLLKIENSDEATLLLIKQYEKFYKEQKQHNDRARPIPLKSKSQLKFDYNNLVEHFNKFDNPERYVKAQERLEKYKKAKTILDRIADNSSLTQAQFESLLDRLVGSKEEVRLWSSGSLYRLRRSVYPFFKEFRDLVRYIRDNKNQKPDIVFEKAKSLVSGIKGASINYITEIMMTYNNKDFANMNNNPLSVLRLEGGVNIKATSTSYTGADYSEYCELIKEISSKFGLSNMLEADSLFDEVFWRVINSNT